jgi:hypothetical protein
MTPLPPDGPRASPPPDPPAPPEATPGLPGLRTWRTVYAFVFGCFVLWVVLLAIFSRIFQ